MGHSQKGSKNIPSLRRVEIREILERHRGSKRAVALALGRDPGDVTKVLKGKTTSAPIMAACEAKARELLKQEAAGKAA